MRVDFHAHILPGVDHGCRDIESSLAALKKAKQEGAETVVATHHFFPGKDDLDKFLEKRKVALETVLSAAKGDDIPNILLGAEVYLITDIVGFERLSELCIQGTRYLLLELPYDYWMPWVTKEIYKIIEEENIIPIIAHVERYAPVRQNHELLGLLSDMGAIIQVNAESLFTCSEARIVKALLKERKIDLLGSDAHTGSDNIYFRRAFEKISKKYGKDYVDLIDENSARILEDRDIVRPLQHTKYRIFNF